MVLVPRRALLIAALALIALVLTRVVGCASSAPVRRGQTRAPVAFVTVRAAAPGRRVPSGFLGLSLEYSSLEAYAGTDPSTLDPVFERLVRNLDPGQAPVLRIGGDSADHTWRPAPGVSRPPGAGFVITDRWLAVTRALARALRARLIVGLNLEADNPALAAAEAGAVLAGVGAGPVRALELGNEPDLYPSFPWYRTPGGRQVTGRPASYDVSSLIGDFSRFAAALPGSALAGPSLGAPAWTRQLGRFLTAEPQVELVTLHRYPLQLCFTPQGSPRHPTIAHLLSPAASIGLADSFAPYARMARARGRPLRIDELNTVSCGADPGVSQTFAAALWALNTLSAMVRVGIHGVNIHTFPGAGYELFRLRRSSDRWRAVVAPEYYGLLLFARAAPAGSRVLDVEAPADGTLHVWATRTRGGTIRVLAVNTGDRARPVSVRIAGASPGRGSLVRLTAPSVSAGRGVALGGRSFASPTFTGRLPGRPRMSRVAAVGGRYTVALPAASAALLVVSPPPAGSA